MKHFFALVQKINGAKKISGAKKVKAVLEPGGRVVFARRHPESGPASAGCSRSGKRDHKTIDFPLVL